MRHFNADGNFKADHVRQNTGDADVWLLDGAGMMCKRTEAQIFLENARNMNTVRGMPPVDVIAGLWTLT